MLTQLGTTSKALLFYALAFGMALLLALFGKGMGEIIRLVSMFTSLAAVLLMLLVVTRDGHTRSGWEMLGLHRLGVGAWGWAIGGPILSLGLAYGIVWATNIGHLDTASWSGPITLDTLLNFVIGFAVGFVAALAEEIGWRGYLLVHLLPLGRMRALLISGFLHGLWHLPLMLLTPYYHADGNRVLVAALFLLTLTAAGLFYGYLRLISGSVWPAALAHGVVNTTWAALSGITLAGASPLLLEYLAGESGLLILIGVSLLSAWLLYRLQRKEKEVIRTNVFVGETTA
jgi:membrane protease YdiL (CAAX protease family)